MKKIRNRKSAGAAVLGVIFMVAVTIALSSTILFSTQLNDPTPAIIFFSHDTSSSNELNLIYSAAYDLTWADLDFRADVAGDFEFLSPQATAGAYVKCPDEECTVTVVYKPTNTMIGEYHFKENHGTTGGTTSSSQGWAIAYGGTSQEHLNDIAITSSGYLLGGDTNSFGFGGYDMLLVKTDTDGGVQWAKNYGGSGSESINAIQLLSSGCLVVGLTTSFGEGNADGLVIKTDDNGNVLWSYSYGKSEDDELYAVDTLSDGYIFGGKTMKFPTGYTNDAIVIKTLSDGTVDWARTYGGPGYDSINNICAKTTSIFLGGSTKSFGLSNKAFFLFSISNSGELLWGRLYAHAEHEDRLACLLPTSDGGFLLGGESLPNNGDPRDCLVIKVNSQGDVQWSFLYGTAEHEYLNSMKETPSGYLIGGETRFSGSWEGFTIHIDSNGDIIDAHCCKDNNGDIISSMASISGGSLLGGTSTGTTAGSSDFLLIKTGSEGILDCVMDDTFTPSRKGATITQYTYEQSGTQDFIPTITTYTNNGLNDDDFILAAGPAAGLVSNDAAIITTPVCSSE